MTALAYPRPQAFTATGFEAFDKRIAECVEQSRAADIRSLEAQGVPDDEIAALVGEQDMRPDGARLEGVL